MINANHTQKNCDLAGCQCSGRSVPPITFVPYKGSCVRPKRPIAAVARHDSTVNRTTHGLRRRRASDTAPSTGIDTTTSNDAMPVAIAYAVSDAPRSTTTHAEKYI